MLANQQLQTTPGCHEVHREIAPASESVGVVGMLAMEILHELGTIEGVSRSRILVPEQETLIAQLTVTALQHSPADGANTWLTVRTGMASGPASTDRHWGVPVAGMRVGH